MNHRKDSHVDIIKQCRYFARGDCAFEKVCWYRHGPLDEVNSQPENSSREDFKCTFCEQCFGDKSEFMKHRKFKHNQIIAKCRDFIQGSCRFNQEECWYSHSEYSVNKSASENAESEVFRKAKTINHPPDMLERLMDMMEQLVKKVTILEKDSRTDQKKNVKNAQK